MSVALPLFLPLGLVAVLGGLVAALDNRQNDKHQEKDFIKALEKAFPTNSLGIFTNSHKMVVYSLDPSTVLPFGQGFHQWAILSTATVERVTMRKEIVQGVIAGVKKGAGGVPPACFMPRHGIRVSQGEATVDLLICFECGHLYSYAGATNGYTIFMGDKRIRELFDSILRTTEGNTRHHR